MGKNKNNKKVLFYLIIVLILVSSFFIYKSTISANTDDNKITIKSARFLDIKTGVSDFTDNEDIVVDENNRIVSFIEGKDSSSDNRIVRSNDQIVYNIGYSIGGKEDENAYYGRSVSITVEISEDESRFISFDENGNVGEISHTFTFDDISTASGENQASIVLYVTNAENKKEINPTFIIKETTDTESGVKLGKESGNIVNYAYENGEYNQSSENIVSNPLPTIVSSSRVNPTLEIVPSYEGQLASYNGQAGRFFTEVIMISIPNTKGVYLDTNSIEYDLSYSKDGLGEPVIKSEWVRRYNNELIENIEPVRVDAPYSTIDGSSSSNSTRYPGNISYSDNKITISDYKVPYTSPNITATGKNIGFSKKIIGTYAVSIFVPRMTEDGKNDINLVLNIGDNSNTFTNKFYEDKDYSILSGFYNESGLERLTRSIDEGTGIVTDLNSMVSKGTLVTYKTEFTYDNSTVEGGLKEVIKVDADALRVVNKNDKEDIDIDITCGSDKCKNLTEKDFEVRYYSGDFNYENYEITDVDERLNLEDQELAIAQCSNIDLSTLNKDQIMNIYGGPCIKPNSEHQELTFSKIRDARDDENNEIPITKIVIQTKEGIKLPEDAKVTVLVYLRVKNVPDITRTYQASVVASTSDTDSNLYYYVPSIDEEYVTSNILNPNNYIKPTITGDTVDLHSTKQYGDALRIVNYTVRQSLTVTNKKADDSIKVNYNVDEDEIINYKLSTYIDDLNNKVGADDSWFIKDVRITVKIPNEYLDYIPDSSLGNPEVVVNGSYTDLVYVLPWAKPNIAIEDIYFNAKLKTSFNGENIPITVTSSIDPININGEHDSSEIYSKITPFTVYGTSSQTVMLSQRQEGSSVIDKDTEFSYILSAFNNTGNDVNDFVITDILPYDKDERGSIVNGNYEVKVSVPSNLSDVELLCSNLDSKTIIGDFENEDIEFEACNFDEYTSSTAIRIKGLDIENNQTIDGIRISIRPTNNKFGNKYINDFSGESEDLEKKTSNKITYSIISRTISGRVFIDDNEDGVRQNNEELVPNLIVNIYKIEDGKVKRAAEPVTTDKNGYYEFKDLDIGLYKVRIKYKNAQYDVALRYGTEDTSIDSDAYKIDEGLAEIISKPVNGESNGINVTQETTKFTNMDMGLIRRRIFGFDINKYITKIDLNYNNTIDTTNYNNESTVLLNVRNTLHANAKVYYGIKITNDSYRPGYVKLVQEDIPDGLIFDSTDPYNKDWFVVGGVLQSTALSNKVIEPGESVYLQIMLYMPERETGTAFINTVSILNMEEYIPVELAKEKEFSPNEYEIGDEVNYAGVNWHVIKTVNDEENNDQVLTLLADSETIQKKMNHTDSSIYKWSESKINNYINNDWFSKNSLDKTVLQDQVVCDDPSSLERASFGGTTIDKGMCTSGVYVTSKVRLFTFEDYEYLESLNLSDKSWLFNNDFWLMNAVNSEIEHDVYGVQTNIDVNKLSTYLTSISSDVASILADSGNKEKEVRPVITISSKNIID